jgi:hemerythrin-like domain-containing protein
VSADPIRRFEEEHDVALAALTQLEGAAEALRSGEASERHFATARQVHAVLCGAVRRHNEDEERALFPVLAEDAPLGPFLDEHETLWKLEEQLAASLDDGDRDRVARVALEIVDLLRTHIQRENEMLFPMARALLGADGLALVARRLELP